MTKQIKQTIELKEPMMKVDIVTCNKCGGRVYAGYFPSLFECKSCDILTDDVSAVINPVTGVVNIVFS